SDRRMLGDVNGDGRADAVVYFTLSTVTGGDRGSAWYVAYANPTGTGFSGYVLWKVNHGNLFRLAQPASRVALADTDGDHTADPVAYFGNTGTWKVMPAATYFKPEMMNFWDAYDIAYRPITHGNPATYDSGDSSVIDEH